MRYMELTGEISKITRPGQLAAGWSIDYIIVLADVLVQGAVNNLEKT